MLRSLTGILLLAAADAAADTSYRHEPCKPVQVSGSCARVHGRLSAGNGTPRVRLWQIGTHHIYGIYSNKYGFSHDSRALDNEAPELHFKLPKGTEDPFWMVYGNFEVCVLEPRTQGQMQAACIAKASHVVAEKK